MELQQDGPVLLKSEFQQFCGKAIRPHCFRICHCLHRCGNLLRGLDPEGTRDWMLRQPLRDVGIEHVGFRVQQRAGETYPPLADTPFVAQQSSFLVADELWFDLLRLLQLHRSDVLEESVLVSHAQLLLQLNDVALEETNDCCTSHFLQTVTCLPDGPPFGRLHSNLAPVSFVPGVGSPIQRVACRYFQHAHFIPIVGVGKRGEY